MWPQQKCTVIVVGGGVGGLVAANFLGQAGHHVTVIEQKAQYLESNSGGGLGLAHNAARCIYALGLREAFERVADMSDEMIVRRYCDGSFLRTVPKKNKKALVHRTDLLRMLYQSASDAGVDVLSGGSFEWIHETGKSVDVRLQSGKTIEADIVIGADGINSRVRDTIAAGEGVRPHLIGHCTFLVDVPRAAMKRHAATSKLYEAGKRPYNLWLGPERSIVGWTMTSRELYHLQINDHNYGDGRAYGAREDRSKQFVRGFDNMPAFRERWDDFEDAIRQLLGETDRCTEWKIAELPELSTWSSEGGRIILIGDAAHAFAPYAGQGACMAIEDAATLATLISKQTPSTPFVNIALAYESIRQPRVSRMREIVNANSVLFSRSDGGNQAESVKLSTAETSSYTTQGVQRKPSPIGEWGTEMRYRWVEDYDALGEARSFHMPSHL